MPRCADDRGAVSLYVIVLLPALFFAVGLVTDGGAKVEALGEARDLADNAARVGAQFSDPYYNNNAIDQAQAAQAINDYVARAPRPSSVSAISFPSPTTIEVVVSIKVDYRILPGSPIVSARGNADAQRD